MSIGGILFLVIAIVALFASIYLVVLSARNWGVLHTLLLCVLFIECVTFLFLSAGVMRKRVDATGDYFGFKGEAEKLMLDNDKLTWGDPNTVSEELDSIVALKAELRRSTLDRGRIWRHARVIDQAGDKIRLELAVSQTTDAASTPPATVPAANAPSAAPAATTPATTTPAAGAPGVGPTASAQASTQSFPPGTFESLSVNTVIYGFAETEPDPAVKGSQGIPAFYLGEFAIVERPAGQVVIRPTAPLEPDQIAYLTEGKANSWSLYENLPVDDHRAYAADGSKPTSDSIFGRMDENTIKQLFADVPAEGSWQEKLIDLYLRDGIRARPDDPPESVWVRIELLKDYSVAVDSGETADVTLRGYFDPSGRSIDIRLKRGEEANLQAGKQLVVIDSVARELVDNGTAKEIERTLVRPLIAWDDAFNTLGLRRQEVIERTAIYLRDLSVLTTAEQLAQAMIAESQVEKQLLSQDLAMHQKELAVVKEAAAEMEAKVKQTKAELSQRYRQIHARHAELTGR